MYEMMGTCGGRGVVACACYNSDISTIILRQGNAIDARIGD